MGENIRIRIIHSVEIVPRSGREHFKAKLPAGAKVNSVYLT